MSETVRKIVFSVLLIIMLGFSFLFGRMSVLIRESEAKRQDIRLLEDLDEPEIVDELISLIKNPETLQNNTTATAISPDVEAPADAKFVASKSSSSKKFHPIDSGNANRIKVENRIYFRNKDEAIKAGYTPAQSVR